MRTFFQITRGVRVTNPFTEQEISTLMAALHMWTRATPAQREPYRDAATHDGAHAAMAQTELNAFFDTWLERFTWEHVS